MHAFQPCWECRTRRLVCDMTLPSCAKCVINGRVCSGYGKRPVRFVQHNPVRSKRRKSPGDQRTNGLEGVQGVRSKKLLPLRGGPPSAWNEASSLGARPAVSSLLRSSSWISHADANREQCKASFLDFHLAGTLLSTNQTQQLYDVYRAWLQPRGRTMRTAIDSVLISHLGRMNQDSRCTHQGQLLYTTAVSQLRRELLRAPQAYDSELIGSVTALALASRLMDDRRQDDRAHLEALIAIFKARGPEVLNSPFERSVCLNVLPKATMLALSERRPLVFGTPQWSQALARIRMGPVMAVTLIAARITRTLYEVDQLANQERHLPPTDRLLDDVADHEKAVSDWYRDLQREGLLLPVGEGLLRDPAVLQKSLPFGSAFIIFSHWTLLLEVRLAAYQIYRSQSRSGQVPSAALRNEQSVETAAEEICQIALNLYEKPESRPIRAWLFIGVSRARDWYQSQDHTDPAQKARFERCCTLLDGLGQESIDRIISWRILVQ